MHQDLGLCSATGHAFLLKHIRTQAKVSKVIMVAKLMFTRI
jgi:hypothetical protein